MVGNQIFINTQREIFQTEVGFQKLGRILMDWFFNEIMEYSGGFVCCNLHTKLGCSYKFFWQIFKALSDCRNTNQRKIPIGIPMKEEKAEIEIHPVVAEAKIRQCSI